jgi:hypothetical protein
VSVVLDAGAFVAVEREDAALHNRLRVIQEAGEPLVTSGAVIGQVWRNGARQVELARLLRGVRVEPLDADAGRAVGVLLAVAASTDVVDAHVALLAAEDDHILTSDPVDLEVLVAARGVAATVVAV